MLENREPFHQNKSCFQKKKKKKKQEKFLKTKTVSSNIKSRIVSLNRKRFHQNENYLKTNQALSQKNKNCFIKKRTVLINEHCLEKIKNVLKNENCLERVMGTV